MLTTCAQAPRPPRTALASSLLVAEGWRRSQTKRTSSGSTSSCLANGAATRGLRTHPSAVLGGLRHPAARRSAKRRIPGRKRSVPRARPCRALCLILADAAVGDAPGQARRPGVVPQPWSKLRPAARACRTPATATPATTGWTCGERAGPQDRPHRDHLLASTTAGRRGERSRHRSRSLARERSGCELGEASAGRRRRPGIRESRGGALARRSPQDRGRLCIGAPGAPDPGFIHVINL